MDADRVRVIYRKYDGTLHYHYEMDRLGEDTHGVWLGQPRGGSMRKGDGPVIHLPHAHVALIPPDAWWTAWFNSRPQRVDIYCDITTPPEWSTPAEVTMVDLDLDVARNRRDRRVVLLDEDEFAEHRVRYAYPPDVIRAAEAAARQLLDAIGAEAEPFADRYQEWLKMVEGRPRTNRERP